MRRVTPFLLLCLPFLTASAQPAADLFISEYIEGSSNNKAIELYNGTSGAVDLAAGGYRLDLYFNGAVTAGLRIGLTGTVAPGDVYVVAHSASAPEILAVADQTNGAGWFNGDDAVVLTRGDQILDVIGQIGLDPGSEWGSGLTSTADNTLRRLAALCAGDANGADAFDPAASFEGFATNRFDGLGSHEATCTTPGNRAPQFTAAPAATTLQPGVLFSFTYEATDADGDALVYSLVTPPDGAAIDPASGVFTWTPSAAQAGRSHTITARVSDGTAQATTSAELTVAPVVLNEPPAFTATLPDTFVSASTAIAFRYAAADPEGEPVVYGLHAPPPGAAIEAATGGFTWTPSTPGVYALVATVTDGAVTTTHRTVVGVRGTLFDGLEGAALRAALREEYTPDQTLGYDRARDTMYAKIDREPDGFVRGVYTGYRVFLPENVDPSTFLFMGGSADGINAEHTWPQSMGAENEPGRSDLHNLFPSKSNANSARSNKPYAELPDDLTESWYRLDDVSTTIPAGDLDEWSENTGYAFEPREDHKGNAARAALYFYTIYEPVSDRGFLLEQQDALLAWNALDPPNLGEVLRNERIARRQGNVNPFLLDPTLAERAVADIHPPDPIAIAEARGLADGTLVTVEGVVTRAAGRFARFQDETAGLTAFQSTGSLKAAVERGDVRTGDRLRITGAIASFNNLRQINPSRFERLGRDEALPAVQRVTLAEILAGGEAYESELIRVDGLRLVNNQDAAFLANRSYTVTDGATSLLLRTPAADDGRLDGAPAPAGLFAFEGVLSQFASDYQLQPVDAADVQVDTLPPVLRLADGPRLLWPLDGTLHPFTVAELVLAVDDGPNGLLPVERATVTRVTSDEPAGGKGADAAIGGDCGSVELRAAREGKGNGRVYTIHLAVTDASGNTGVAAYPVHVAHDQGQGAAVDDGPAYAVEAACAPALAGSAAKHAPGAGGALQEQSAPLAFELSPAYPNPFNPRAAFTLSVDADQFVRVEVFNLLGQRVALLHEGVLPAGRRHAFTFEASHLPSGTYLVRAAGEQLVRQQAMVLVK